MNFSFTQVFESSKLRKYHLVFESKSQSVEYDSNQMTIATRSICKSIGVEDRNLAQFTKIVGKPNFSPEDSLTIQKFMIEGEHSLDKLGLISQATKADSCLYVQSWRGIHNVRVTQNVEEIVPSKALLFDCRKIVYNRFQDLSEEHIAPLTKIADSLDMYNFETSVLILPYLVGVLTLSTFLKCFSHLDQNGFFKSLFRTTVESIKSRIIPFYRQVFQSEVFKGVLKACVTSGGFYFIWRFFSAPVVVNELAVTEQLVIPDNQNPMERYRFKGQAGEAVRTFKDITGGILYTFCDVLHTYRNIVVYTTLEPLLERSKELYNFFARKN